MASSSLSTVSVQCSCSVTGNGCPALLGIPQHPHIPPLTNHVPPHQDVCESRHLRLADSSGIQQPFPRREGEEALGNQGPGHACGVCAKTWLGQTWAPGLQLQN